MLDTKIYLKMHNDFRRTFFKTIYPSLKLMEKERIKRLIVTIIINLILISVGIYFTLNVLSGGVSLDEESIFKIGIIIIGSCFGIWRYNKKNLKEI